MLTFVWITWNQVLPGVSLIWSRLLGTGSQPSAGVDPEALRPAGRAYLVLLVVHGVGPSRPPALDHVVVVR